MEAVDPEAGPPLDPPPPPQEDMPRSVFSEISMEFRNRLEREGQWTMHRALNGRIFFRNRQSGRTQWEWPDLEGAAEGSFYESAAIQPPPQDAVAPAAHASADQVPMGGEPFSSGVTDPQQGTYH